MHFTHTLLSVDAALSTSVKRIHSILDSNALMPMGTSLMKLCVTALLVSFALTAQAPSAHARTEQFTFEVPINNPIGHREIIGQVEVETQAEISRQFRQNPEMSTIQMSVLANRNGEVIPVFVTTVSRAEWQQDPQITRWTKYHNSYALLKRHDLQNQTVAIAPPRQSAIAMGIAPFSRAVDAAFDRGGLSSQKIQNSLDYWD